MPPARLLPKVSLPKALTEARLFKNQALRALKKYPARSPRSRYRRTYTLRRGWKGEVGIFSGDLDIDIFNDEDYAGFLQGRRAAKGEIHQTKRAQRQGWISLTDIDRNVWPKHRFRIARALGIRPRRVNF